MQARLSFDPGDIGPSENGLKVADALERFTVEKVVDLPAFYEGYALLEAQFGPVGEIERREVLERWFQEGTLSPPEDAFQAHYHMAIARDRDGRIAGVRDCFCAVQPELGRVVVLLSHSLVFPEWRRTGISALLRAVPVPLARRDAHRFGVERPEILLIAEMDPVEPTVPASLVRLMAYGRGGFAIVPPWKLPYAQPDFRDLEALAEAARPLPLMWVVRQVGAESAGVLAWEKAVSILDGLRAIHTPAVSGPQLAEIRAHALGRKVDSEDAISLIPLPHTPSEFDRIEPLVRSALYPLYPESWHVRPRGDAQEEIRQLHDFWKEST